MKHTHRMVLCALSGMFLASTALPLVAQETVDYKKYPDYSRVIKADRRLLNNNWRSGQRPDRVNNAENIHFPPIISQDGGSCGSASRIAYMFAYEINALRNVSGLLEENRYPTHFTWLLTNSSSNKEAMAIANGVPNMPTYGGATYSSLMGYQDCSDPDFGWMQGYDKWYSAMFNRVERTANFPVSVATEEGREAVKQWLWNHSGDTDFAAGGICGIGVASGGIWENIPRTAANDAAGVTGKYFVSQWGKQVDHALTIVGYDDRIEFDLDGNGVIGEADKDEVGAWIIANSWGASWCNNGFIYCPYKNAITRHGTTDYYMPEIYYMRKNYRPLRTIKIKMDFSKRSELRLSAGIAADTAASIPESTTQFEHFKFAGDGNGDGVDAETPMLGRWKDGLHHEPMEFGYDLTDLSAGFDTRKPLKYFFIIESKETASGTGTIHDCSIIDYEFYKDGIETLFNIPANGINIQNKGGKTTISVIVYGEEMTAPRNLSLNEGTLQWEAPAPCTQTLTGYNIYCNSTSVAKTDAATLSYDVSALTGTIEVAAIYQCGDTEAESKRMQLSTINYYGQTPESNYVRKFTKSGFEIVDILKEQLETATIEYWICPALLNYDNQQIGPGWENGFMAHATKSGQLVVGWNMQQCITSKASTLRANAWTHVAIVVVGGKMTAYANGQPVGEIITSNKGIGGFGSLPVGTGNTNAGINGTMDEFRVWNVARTQREIQSMMYSEVADPQNTPGLLAEVRMDSKDDGTLLEATNRYVVKTFEGTQSQIANSSLLNDKRAIKADFSTSEEVCYAGTEINIVNKSSANTVKWVWNVDGKNYETEHPTFVFDTTGEKTVILTAYNGVGDTAQCHKNILIEKQPIPVAGFTCPDSVPAYEPISFSNSSKNTAGCVFHWEMPGAQIEHANTTNTATHYPNPGIYTVTLTVTNNSGSSSVSKEIVVTEIHPEAAFGVSPDVVVKGNPVKLEDKSLYSPTHWHWTIKNNAHHYIYDTADCELIFENPGKYDVSLEVSNSIGSSHAAQSKAITVCNADAKTGLAFNGESNRTVTFDCPLALSQTHGFTIDWWMNAKGNQTYSQAIGGSESDLLIRSLADGTLQFCMGSSVYTSAPGFFIPGEWHHYAIVFNFGDVFIYRDCMHFETFYTRFMGVYPAMPTTFKLGGSNGAVNAIIDEFRVWNTALTSSVLKSYANAPIDDVETAESAHKLVLYYNFNQSSGDVQDATSHAHHGTRTGFGPEGDAWSSSLGVFCLNEAQREDASATYLTNYCAPFVHSGKDVNTSESGRYMELLQGTEESAWVVEGSKTSGTIITGVHVDTKENNVFSLITKENGFGASVISHNVYQTVTLPAGHYVFGFESANGIFDKESYIVVNKGKGFPNVLNLQKESFAYTTMDHQELEFTLTEETEVSLGMQFNTRGSLVMQIQRFFLEKKISNDDFSWTGIEEAPYHDQGEEISIVSTHHGIDIKTGRPQRINIYSVAGALIHSEVINGNTHIALPAGVYIINGRKYLVR